MERILRDLLSDPKKYGWWFDSVHSARRLVDVEEKERPLSLVKELLKMEIKFFNV